MRSNRLALFFGLLAALLPAPAGLAQDAPLQHESSTAARRGGSDVTVVSVLAKARDLAESASNEEHRRGLRLQVARLIKRARHEAAFGTYVADAIRDAAAHDRSMQEARDIEEQAKAALLAGDDDKALRTLAEGKVYEFLFHRGIVIFQFLDWELDAGNLDAALYRLETSTWPGDIQMSIALHVAWACIDAGRRDDGVNILLRNKSRPNVDLPLLAEALWKIGAVEEARAILDQVVAAAFAAAEQDPARPLPAEAARIQMVIGDRYGAAETLRGIRRFAVPIEYEPVPEGRLTKWIQPRAEIKPDAFRWIMARSKLPHLLARTGLDVDAFALIGEPLANQPQFLAGIVRGQAERGDFVAAFRTLDLLRTVTLTVPVRNSDFKGEGIEFRYENKGTSITTATTHERRRAVEDAMLAIKESSAQLGNEEAFRRTVAVRPLVSDGNYISRYLVKGGLVDTAVELALEGNGMQGANLRDRIHSLGAVALALAGITEWFEEGRAKTR